MGGEYTYYAFISYSHKDEKWAQWIQRALENYRLPAVIRKETGKQLPKRLTPIFRDATDLAIGKLNDNLHRELESSRYLIVICSPNSAKPNLEGKHFVNAEVEHFNSLGRSDCIIPVIVDGIPGDPERECFCPKLKELDLLGVDATKIPRERLLNDVVAKILNLRPDELWQREKRRRTRNRIRMTIGGTLLLMLLLAGGYIAYDWFHAHIEYYADYGDSFGLPYGIFPLAEKQTKSRSSHYRFIYRGRRRLFGERLLREVIHCNSARTPTDPERRVKGDDLPTWSKINYDSDLGLLYIDICEKNGRLRERREFSGRGKTVIDFKTKDRDDVLVGAFQRAASGSGSKAEIRRWRIQRDERTGRPLKILFFRNDVVTLPSRNADGFFGYEFEYDRLGRVTRRYYLDENGEHMMLKNGTAATVYMYCEYGISSIGNSDNSGKLMEQTVFGYDADGNVCKIVNCMDGRRTFRNGFAEEYDKYDERGNLVERVYFGIDGKPCMRKDGFAKIEYKYDDCGNIVEVAYFGTDGKPCLHKDGFAKVTASYDERGNLIEQAYFGSDGKPCVHKDGNAKVVFKYDGRGNCIEEAYLGTDGKLCMIKDGYAKWASKYDERGNLIEEACFGIDGKPCLHKDGYAKLVNKYDERGNYIEGAFFDTNGKLCINKDGYAKLVNKYDARGNRIEQVYFGTDGKPCMHRNGHAKLTIAYDDRDNFIEEAYFGVDSKPCMIKDGYAKSVNKYDERGNLIEAAFFGIDGKPCINKTGGYARFANEYNELGQFVSVKYFDAAGRELKQ